MATAKKPVAKKKAPGSPYVYALVDAGQVFYIGKGRGQRMYAHVKDAQRGCVGPKCDRIRAILASGREVEHRVLAVYQSDTEAYAAERDFIAAHSDLTNIASGGGALAVAPKERMRQQAQNMLDRMQTFEDWLPCLTDAGRNVITTVFGSPRAFYDRLVEALRNETSDPQPNFMLVRQNGTVEMGWV